ncbi:hypothetical protein BZA05DRAFT_419571 [Tricharina praecox]|uniref:uncharacterized protein n=1 Tax=Tricharina praecox TaxID=43433 RepID=UPI00221F86ED|nr:uncharacterized protein BZA05DRAFT_419571 [Tricharina praecox]KAI5849751.1 hypothetical protein BZA05DRAFT_419571 [Tricharina praecox]
MATWLHGYMAIALPRSATRREDVVAVVLKALQPAAPRARVMGGGKPPSRKGETDTISGIILRPRFVSAGAFPIDNRQISSLHCGQQPPLESPLHLQYYLTSQSRLIRDCQRECTLPPQDLAKYNGPWGISIRIKSDRDLSAIIAYCARRGGGGKCKNLHRACIQTFSRQSIALVLTLSGNWSLEASLEGVTLAGRKLRYTYISRPWRLEIGVSINEYAGGHLMKRSGSFIGGNRQQQRL